MTVCIAAAAERGRTIVFASDHMATMAASSADHVMSKADFLTPFWLALWSGDDVSSIPPMMRRARAKLKDCARNATVEQVAEAVSSAYQHETQDRAVAEILSIYGLDMPGFLANGETIFGETGFSLIQQRLEQYDLGNVELLICGFDELSATIFSVGRGGIVRYWDRLGFWAIGSGNHLAISSLAFRQHNSLKRLDEAIYCVYEAKFRAESAVGVGKTTTIGLLRRNDDPTMFVASMADRIRNEWERYGKPPIPPSALEDIRAVLYPKANPVAPRSPQRSKRGRKHQPPSQE